MTNEYYTYMKLSKRQGQQFMNKHGIISDTLLMYALKLLNNCCEDPLSMAMSLCVFVGSL